MQVGDKVEFFSGLYQKPVQGKIVSLNVKSAWIRLPENNKEIKKRLVHLKVVE